MTLVEKDYFFYIWNDLCYIDNKMMMKEAENMVENAWIQNATKNLLPLSNSSDFANAKKEWEYVGLIDNEEADFDCQLCGHKEIRYEYTIENRINQNEMIVGSSCILKFITHLAETQDFFYDTQNNIIDKTRLENDKHDYWVDILFKSLDANFSNNDFQISITDQIETDGKLTINQAKCLIKFYYNLNPNEQSAFKYIVSIKLRKDIQKNQYTFLKGYDKEFIDMLLSPQQRKIVQFI